MRAEDVVTQLKAAADSGEYLSVSQVIALFAAWVTDQEKRIDKLESLHSDHQHVDALWYLNSRVEALESNHHNHGENLT